MILSRSVTFRMRNVSKKILVYNQIDAQFFMYVYFYSVHVSGSHVPIIRRIVVSMRYLVYVTLCIWPSGMQEHMLLHTRRWHKPGVAMIQYLSWWWAHGYPKHVENRNKHTWKTASSWLFTRIIPGCRSTKHRISEKSCRENQNTHFMLSNIFFRRRTIC